MRTLGGVRSDEATQEYVYQNLQHWDKHGYGLWILQDRSDGNFVGRSALRKIDLDGNHEVEIGYALMPEYWGLGLATEVTKAMLEVAFSRLGLSEVVALILPHNEASKRVIEKAGGHYEQDTMRAASSQVTMRICGQPQAL